MNDSIVVGERAVLKWQRRIGPPETLVPELIAARWWQADAT
jgi:hypothetical protein